MFIGAHQMMQLMGAKYFYSEKRGEREKFLLTCIYVYR